MVSVYRPVGYGLAPAISSLRTLVIATHGPEAWPWAMREAKHKEPPVHFGVHGAGLFWSTGCYGPVWRVDRVSTDPAKVTCGGCKRSRAWRKAKEAADALCDPGGEP